VKEIGLQKFAWIVGAVVGCFILGIIALSFAGRTNDGSATRHSDSQRSPTDAPATPTPTATPLTASLLMREVRNDVTPELIAGNASKYVGSYVLIECQIRNVIGSGDDKEANASCTGVPGQGNESALVITGNVGNFDAGQTVTILGQVSEPSEGTNTFGTSTTFPTVHMLFLNPSLQQEQTTTQSANDNTQGNPEENAIIAFYSNISQKNFDAAYAGLSNAYRSTTSRSQFEAGYATTISVDASAHSRGDEAHTVDVVLHAVDSKNGETVHTTYTGVWHLVRGSDGTWLLDNGQFKKTAE